MLAIVKIAYRKASNIYHNKRSGWKLCITDAINTKSALSYRESHMRARQTLLNATRGKLWHFLFFFFLFSTDSLVPSRCSARSRRAKLEKWSWPEFICLRREHRLARPQKATVRDARSIRTRACGGCDLYSRRAQKARWIIAEVPPHGIAEREGGRGRPGRDKERMRKSEMASAVDCRGYFRMYIIDIINSMLLLYVVTSELVETYI